MSRYKPVGWRKDSVRHSLAAKGIRTSMATIRTYKNSHNEKITEFTLSKGDRERIEDKYGLELEDLPDYEVAEELIGKRKVGEADEYKFKEDRKAFARKPLTGEQKKAWDSRYEAEFGIKQDLSKNFSQSGEPAELFEDVKMDKERLVKKGKSEQIDTTLKGKVPSKKDPKDLVMVRSRYGEKKYSVKPYEPEDAVKKAKDSIEQDEAFENYYKEKKQRIKDNWRYQYEEME